MQRLFLRSKVYGAIVTDAQLTYEGSLELDSHIIEKAHMSPYEKVLVVDSNNGNRFETYLIPGKPKSGVVRANGAAARLVYPGDYLIIMTFAAYSDEELKSYHPNILKLSQKNEII